MSVVNDAQRFNKATASALVLVAGYVASLFGVDVPAEIQVAVATVLVWAVPNK